MYKLHTTPYLVLVSTVIFSSSASANRTIDCETYARTASKQHTENIKLSCDYHGLRWSNNKAGHQHWCETVRYKISASETKARDKLLKECKVHISSSLNPDNKVQIPSSCRDPLGKYRPVRSIYHSFRYETQVKYPVTHGLISYDFNHDQLKDYLFIERNSKDRVRLLSCISSTQGYQRKLSNLSFNALGDSTMGGEFTISHKANQIDININYFEHNAGSSWVQSSYQYSQPRKIFVLKSSQSDSSPVLMDDGSPYPMYVPQAPKL
ncbi:MAG: hypothetical protein KAH22_02610 [Thiotrichaceae bacterium]|nr:hypothetical protein [Thiotrichaceae bacterium]